MSDTGYSSTLSPNSDAGRFNEMMFVIQSAMSRLATTTLVKVLAVTNSGGVEPVGTVDVQPMVNQIDGLGNATPHGTIYKLPYVRIQGGANAIIIDPQVGDIGWAGFCSTDISSVKATKGIANPGSRRRFDWADGLFLGAMLGAAPAQYIQFNDDGITIVSPTKVTLQAPEVHVEGDLTVSGDVTADGEVTGNGVALSTHVHGDVTSGSDDTGPPV